jgi:hypothetical protein
MLAKGSLELATNGWQVSNTFSQERKKNFANDSGLVRAFS